MSFYRFGFLQFNNLFISHSFQQLAIILLTLHYVGDALQHGARLVHFISQRESRTKCMSVFVNRFVVINAFYYLN